MAQTTLGNRVWATFTCSFYPIHYAVSLPQYCLSGVGLRLNICANSILLLVFFPVMAERFRMANYISLNVWYLTALYRNLQYTRFKKAR